MKNKELCKIQSEFAKIPKGKRANIFSIAPFFIGLLFVIGYGLSLKDGKVTILNTYMICFAISVIGGCIAQLIYGYFLKEYIKSNK